MDVFGIRPYRGIWCRETFSDVRAAREAIVKIWVWLKEMI